MRLLEDRGISLLRLYGDKALASPFQQLTFNDTVECLTGLILLCTMYLALVLLHLQGALRTQINWCHFDSKKDEERRIGKIRVIPVAVYDCATCFSDLVSKTR